MRSDGGTDSVQMELQQSDSDTTAITFSGGLNVTCCSTARHRHARLVEVCRARRVRLRLAAKHANFESGENKSQPRQFANHSSDVRNAAILPAMIVKPLKQVLTLRPRNVPSANVSATPMREPDADVTQIRFEICESRYSMVRSEPHGFLATFPTNEEDHDA